MKTAPKMLTARHPAGFTLVEILTVIVIIGILVGMITAAAGPVRNTVRNWRMKSEILQLSLALEEVKTRLGGGEYPPGDNTDMLRFLRRAFPRTNISQTDFDSMWPAGIRGPASTLVFWLGGRWDSTSQTFVGFSADPTDPFNLRAGHEYNPNSPEGRIGPFFNFDRNRLWQCGSGGAGWTFWQYFPQNDQFQRDSYNSSTSVISPYLYFKAIANQYAGGWTPGAGGDAIRPFADYKAMQAAGTGTTIWMNPASFQILCPGLDGRYSPTTPTPTVPPYYPDGTNYGQYTFDDITNFSNGKVENDMP